MRVRVSRQGFCEFGETVRRKTMGDNEYTLVRAPFVVELERETDKVVAIFGYHATPLQSSPLQLLEIRKPFSPDLVNTKRIHAAAAEQLGDALAQIFIKVIPQERSCCMRTGDGATGDRTYDTNDG